VSCAAQDSKTEVLSQILLDRQQVEKFFVNVASEASDATVTVRSGNTNRRIMATCVSAKGIFLTKESEITEDLLRVIDSNQQEWPATILASDSAMDLALIQVSDPKTKFRPVAFEEVELKAGQWVALPKDSLGRLRVGVVSVGARRFGLPPSRGAFLGVNLEDATPGARIVKVEENTAAALHGLVMGDIVLNIDGHEVGDREELVSELRVREPEATVKLKLKRGEELLEVDVRLGRRDPVSEEGDRRRGLRAQPETSDRKSGFPSAFQHDINMQPHHAGTPVIDRLGRVIGINIARASRTAAVAIPSDRVNLMLKEYLKD
jgi:S1-C subfamily serine protease